MISFFYKRLLFKKYFGMRLFFLTIPKPLKQYTLLKKKMIHSALPFGLEAEVQALRAEG